jgi:flagellin-like hook-associated protein FlgL
MKYMDGLHYFQPNVGYVVVYSDKDKGTYTSIQMAGIVTENPGLSSVGLKTTGYLYMLNTSNVSSGQAVHAYVEAIDVYIKQMNDVINNAIEVMPPFPSPEEMMDALNYNREAAVMIYSELAYLRGLSISAEGINGFKAERGLYFQTGANSGDGVNVGIGAITAKTLGIGNEVGDAKADVNERYYFRISNELRAIDHALTSVTDLRAKIGAVQNRLEHSKNAVQVASENLSNAKSRIADADMAMEMMRIAEKSVLRDASLGIMAQANHFPDSVLQLLQQR